jgi:o-succinylbenzoate synthase
MRIAELRWAPYSLPLRRPFATSRSVLAARQGFLVAVRSAEGPWGCGECAPLPEFGGETLVEAAAALSRWAATLPGREVELPARLVDSTPPALGLVATPAPTPCAFHALEGALLDLAARRAGLPLARWLHPRAASEVAVNATLGAGPPEAAAEAARAFSLAGFGTFKVKVGVGGADADEARLRAVRVAVPLAARLRIDANGAWSEGEALGLLNRWRALELEFVEQPLDPRALDAQVRLAAASPVPIAADEGVRSEEDARRLLEARAAHLLVLKPMLLGGVLTAYRIARLALGQGVPVVLSTALEGAYGRTAALHVAAAVQALQGELLPGAAAIAHGLATAAWLREDLVAPFPEPVRGKLIVPAPPGLGLPLPAWLAGLERGP